MGKYRVTVATSVNRVIDDLKIPRSVSVGVTRAIFKNESIPGNILGELTGSLALKTEAVFRFVKNGHYHLGLPSGQFFVQEDGFDEVSAVLASIEGQPVLIDYVKHARPNNLHVAWMNLISQRGYDTTTNVLGGLTTSLGTTVWLQDMRLVVPIGIAAETDPRSLTQVGISPKSGYSPLRPILTAAARAVVGFSGVKGASAGTAEYARVSYVYKVAGVNTFGSFDLPLTGYLDQLDYYQVKYSVGGAVKYWMYRDGNGAWPTLDGLFGTAQELNGTFFPFVYFRHNSISDIDTPGSQAVITSRKLMKKLGMDYDAIAESVKANPDIADVTQAVMMWAVPANTGNEVEQRYLYEFFENVFLSHSAEYRFANAAVGSLYIAFNRDLYVDPPRILISDGRFKMALEIDGIYMRNKTGLVCPVGQHRSFYTSVPITRDWVDVDTGVTYSTSNGSVDSHFYQKQITKDRYAEIQVVNLRTLFNVTGNYAALYDDTDPQLLIPLDHSITVTYSLPDREELYARSMHYVFNAANIVKVKWYETGIFKVVMILAAIAITIYTLGAGTPALIAALAAGEILLASVIVLDLILVMVIAQIAFKLFVKIVGVKVAFIVAIIAFAVGMGMAINAGSIAGAPWATELLSLSNGLTKAVQAGFETDIASLVGQAKEFDLYKDAKIKTLETAQELLENRTFLNPFVIFGESPDDYYNRTVHSGNIGVVGIEAVSDYTKTMLQLPQIQQTLSMGQEYPR